MRLLIVLVLFYFCSCGVQHRLSGGAATKDTSFVYRLPYAKGVSRLLIQGYNSRLSHRGRLGLDFKMKRGSPVHAARSGVVVRLQEGFTKGGPAKKYYGKANQVVILHADGSQAYYGHLQHNGVLVNVGDRITQGQLIALSGSTGYSALPHLHLIIWGPLPGGGRSQLPTRFHTQKGMVYLRPGHWYKTPRK